MSNLRAVTMHPDVSRSHLEHSQSQCGAEPCSAICVLSRLRHAMSNRSAQRRNAREEIAAYGRPGANEPRVRRAEDAVRQALALGGMSESLTAACEEYLR